MIDLNQDPMKKYWTVVFVSALLALSTGCLRFPGGVAHRTVGKETIASIRERELDHNSDNTERNADLVQEVTPTQNSDPLSEFQENDPEQATNAQEELEEDAANHTEESAEGLEGSSPSLDQETQTAEQSGGEEQSPSSAPLGRNWPFSTAPKELEPGHSYMIAGLHLAEGAQFIPSGSSTNPFQAYSTTRVFGSFALVKEIRRFSTQIDYKGGGFFYRDTGSPWSKNEVQQLTVTEDIAWQRTRVRLEDSISDFPGSSFSSAAFGGSGSYTLGFGGSSGSSDFFGFNDFGGLGAEQHITNVALASATQEVTPRSGVVVAGAEAFTHYFGNNSISSQQASGIVGYYHNLSQRTTVSTLFGYQNWTFGGGESSDAYTAQLALSRQFSPRLNLSVGGGPQIVTSHSITEGIAPLTGTPVAVPVSSRQIGFTANGYLAYSLRRQTLNVFYEHLLTSGSGLYAGANSDIATVTLLQPMLREWATTLFGGFVHLSSIGNGSAGILGNSYQYGFVGFGLQRRIGRHLSVLGSYQFNGATNSATCTPAAGCGQIVHTVLFNLSWHTLPISLDRGSYRGTGTVPDSSAGENVESVPSEPK